MSVEFDEQGNTSTPLYSSRSFVATPKKEVSGMVKLVIKTGIVSDPTKAQYVLLAIVLFLILAALFIFIALKPGAVDTSQTKQQVQKMETFLKNQQPNETE